jgi:hypothetical protein
MKVEKFEIDSWGCVKLKAYANGRNVEYEYNGVPKKLILKLLQAKSTPDLSDFDGWMRDYRNKEEPGLGRVVCDNDWWHKSDDN